MNTVTDQNIRLLIKRANNFRDLSRPAQNRFVGAGLVWDLLGSGMDFHYFIQYAVPIELSRRTLQPKNYDKL